MPNLSIANPRHTMSWYAVLLLRLEYLWLHCPSLDPVLPSIVKPELPTRAETLNLKVHPNSPWSAV